MTMFRDFGDRVRNVVPASNMPPLDRSDASYVDPTLALPRAWWFTSLQWLVVVVAAGGDAANFYLSLAVVAYQLSTPMLYMAVGALTVAAVAIMYAVGVTARDSTACYRPILRTPSIWVLTVMWLSLGAASCALRIWGEADTGPSLSGLEGLVPTGSSPQEHRDKLLLAGMMLVLYLATGSLAAWFAYHHHNPYHAAAKRARREISRINRKVAALRVMEQRYDEQVNLLLEESANEADRKFEDLAICSAHAKELKKLARVELSLQLKDPAATSALINTTVRDAETKAEPEPTTKKD